MRNVLLVAALAAVSLLSGCGQPKADNVEAADTVEVAAPATPGDALAVSDAYAGATPDGAKVAAGYMTISNPGAEADRLLSATSARAGAVEIHEMATENGMMTMRPLPNGLEVPAQGSVSLAPGGAHLMFMNITAPFAQGETIPVTLTFEKAGVVETTLPVKQREAHDGH